MPLSPILARADALMQRRRQNIGEIDDVPILTDAVTTDSDDDVPILLDIEHFAPLVEPEAVIAESDEPQVIESIEKTTAPPAFDAALRDIMAHELARRVEQRIAAELPRIIESTVRDYLAEQEMIARLQPRD
jgi:hypothetical protein